VEGRLNGRRKLPEDDDPWRMLDRLVLLLARQRGETARIWLRDLLLNHGTATSVALARIVAVQLYPFVFPDADWEPVRVETAYKKRSKGLRVVYRRRPRQVPKPDPLVPLLQEVMVNAEKR